VGLSVPFDGLMMYDQVLSRMTEGVFGRVGCCETHPIPCVTLLFAVFLVVFRFNHTYVPTEEDCLNRMKEALLPGVLRCPCTRNYRKCVQMALRLQTDVIQAAHDFSVMGTSPLEQELAVSSMSGLDLYRAVCRAYAKVIQAPDGYTASSVEFKSRVSWLTSKECQPPASWFWVCSDFKLQ
jgi:hypothetical protein